MCLCFCYQEMYKGCLYLTYNRGTIIICEVMTSCFRQRSVSKGNNQKLSTSIILSCLASPSVMALTDVDVSLCLTGTEMQRVQAYTYCKDLRTQ